ncbi:MAG: VanZ family protein [Oscillospiraceae bacterium]|jgi:glycopeptide antibiotics resistance protein|nr:VanZ family protein [Oscillospiraceae bacterium]
MQTYFISLTTAAWVFPVIAFLASLPYAVYNYRKYGAVSIFRTFVLFSFVFYLLCAYLLIILPLPNPADVANYTSAQFDTQPFAFVINFVKHANFRFAAPSTWLHALKTPYFLEPFFNLCLLGPLGFYLAYYFKCDRKKIVLTAFFVSFFFELTQLSGLYGIYPRPYRLFSVDDLMLNTLGGIIGYGVYAMLKRILPNRDRIDSKNVQKSARVGYIRRVAALLVDSAIVGLALILLNLLWNTIKIDSVASFVLSLVYSIGLTLLTKGRTAGKALVRIKVVRTKDGARFFPAVALRYLLRISALYLFQFVSLTTIRFDGVWQLILLIIAFAAAVFFAVDMLYALKKGRRLWYERLTHTENVSTYRVAG